MSSRPHPLSQRGDTLVEVLIAMVIVAVVLGGAYVSSNNSFKTTQAAKERDIALRLAEMQLERIRGFKVGSPSAPIANGSCMTSALAIVNNSGALPTLSADNLTGSGGIYNGSCVLSTLGTTYGPSSDTPFHIYNEVSGSDYTVHVRWARFGGGQNQETILKYRYY